MAMQAVSDAADKVMAELQLARAVVEAARALADEARPHTDFAKLWAARDFVWKQLKAYDSRSPK
jgi:hypothetical protein